MFEASSNDGFYELGLGVLEVIRTALGELPLAELDADAIIEGQKEQEVEQDDSSAKEKGEAVEIDDPTMQQMRTKDERVEKIHDAAGK
jgi:hypothetical protein